MLRSLPLGALGLLVAAGALSACALVRTKYWHSYADDRKDDVALVYGYIDMSQAPAPLQRLRAARLGAPEGEGDVYFETHGGMFYNEALPAGDYKLAAVEGTPGKWYVGPVAIWPGQPYAAAIPAKLGAFHVEGPGLYYVGSYRYKRLPGFVESFTVERSTAPTERQLLRGLSAVLIGKWEKPVARQLRTKPHEQ